MSMPLRDELEGGFRVDSDVFDLEQETLLGLEGEVRIGWSRGSSDCCLFESWLNGRLEPSDPLFLLSKLPSSVNVGLDKFSTIAVLNKHAMQRARLL